MAQKTPLDYVKAIELSGKDIYYPIEIGDENLWIPTPTLELLLNQGLIGLDLSGLALRTRSKIVKEAVCRCLGYPIPKSFRKTQPRFFGQQLDTYSQKSLNLQIWNEDLSPYRRYAIIQISDSDKVLTVKVVNGQELALLDTTGTITKKYQASVIVGLTTQELISEFDTEEIREHVRFEVEFPNQTTPVDEPESGKLLAIQVIYNSLSSLVGKTFTDPGIDQERNRGAALHRMVCNCLGYSSYLDKGQFPDLRHQLLEVKLQTSPTIDLGLVLPNSTEHLDIKQLGSYHPKHCDTRYAIFFAETDNVNVTLTHLFVTTGKDFFTRFRQFEGKTINGKIQIPLPRNFFGL